MHQKLLQGILIDKSRSTLTKSMACSGLYTSVLFDALSIFFAAKNPWASIYGKDDEMAGGARTRCQ
jgi:hypothetical protein